MHHATNVEFRLLGPFDLVVDGRSVEVRSPKLRALLVALLLEAGRPVSVAELADAMWGADQPDHPRRAVQLSVTRLRRLLAESAPDVEIATSRGSYGINVRPEQLDLCRWYQYLDQATKAADRGALDEESAALGDALALWRGRPLAGVPSELLQREVAPQLREQRLLTMERRFDVELHRGRHADVVHELLELTAQHPLREPLWAQLMTALHRSWRRTDALDAYHTVRRHLADELGVDPGADLQALYARILTGGSNAHPTPRQLPADVPTFVGRAKELAQLDDLLTTTSTIIAVITGTAGVGKTAMVAHWARSVADRFPDGQLWLNLRGFDLGQVVTPGQALTRFLRSLGVPDAEIPLDVDERADLYRSMLDGRRVLVVLDNAASTAQVRPLFPGTPGCLVLVISRSQLSDLDAHALALDLLDHAEARQLLARRLGADRVHAEDAAVDEIVNRSARLPLALAIVAARASAHPTFDLTALAAELRAARGSLGAFTGADPATEMRAVFSWSYRSVSSAARRLFRLLGLHPGPDVGAAAIASLAGLPAGLLLAELVDAHLISEHVPGRYAFHDLLRAYAVELGQLQDSPTDRRDARRRMFDHYLLTACAAAETLPAFESVQPDPPDDGVTAEKFADSREALIWYTTEHQVLLATVEEAARSGFWTHARQLAWMLVDYLHGQGHWHDWTRVLQTVLDGATRPDERVEQARSHRGLACAYARLGHIDPAVAHGRLALQLSDDAGDDEGLALGHSAFAYVFLAQGHLDEALHHDMKALKLFSAIDHRAGRARALNSVGWTWAMLGDYEQTLDFCRQALTLVTEVGDRQGQAATLDSLGYAYHHLGQYQQAITCYHHAIELLRDIGARFKEAESLIALGDAHKTAGYSDAARTVWEQALEVLTDLGHREAEPVRAKLRQLDRDSEGGIR